MKDLTYLDQYRQTLYGERGDAYNGAFKIPMNSKYFTVIASNGGGWEHVSISILNSKRTPTWSEMCQIKDMFFNENEVVMQLHPAKKEYVNIKNNCLHLWRPIGVEIPTPPRFMV